VTDVTASVLAEALRDRYTLARELGRGGMATVYLARDLRHDRDVALKVLRPDLAAVLGRERFLAEIRLTAKLDHPHILTLIDSGESNGILWYVVPFIRGESLRQKLQREKQLSLDEAQAITKQVAGALEYAHQQGVIHRDLKPENILLHEGEAMLADFGIALAVKEAGGNRLTETGLSLGTPQYMSPEQATGSRQLDARSDVYSLGAVLYEMLAGEPPHTGATVQAVIAKLMAERPTRLRTIRDVIPEGVDEAVARALAKVPADRYASAAAFATALAAPAGAPRGKKNIRRRVVTLGLSAAVLGLAVLVARPMTMHSPGATTHHQVTFIGRASAPALSPDDHWLAYVADNSLFVQDLRSTAAAVSIASAPRLLRVRWGPDGSRLYYLAIDSSGYAIHAVLPQGGASRRIGPGYHFDVASTGNVIYSSLANDSVAVFDAATGERRGGFSLKPLANDISTLAISPDGRWLAFVGVKASVTFLGVCGIDGSQARRLVEGVPRDGSISWSKSGDAIYYLRDLGNGANVAAAGDLMKLRISRGAPRGIPEVVLGGAYIQEFSVSPAGRHVAYTKAPPQQKLWAMTLTGAASRPSVEARELTVGTSVYGTPDISPDGRWVAFARNEGGTGNLYITPFDHYEPRPLTTSPDDEWSPRWSPDARHVAYAVRNAQSPGILVADVATGQVRRVANEGLAPLGVIAWMPSGQEIVFPLDLGNHYAIVNLTDGATDTLASPESVAGFHLTVPAPDGHHVIVNVSGGLELGFWRLAGVERSGRLWKWYDTGGRQGWLGPLLWKPDGWIYFLSAGSDLYRVRAEGGMAAHLVRLPEPCSVWQTALDTQARRLVCTVSDTESDIWLVDNFDSEDD
jgi:eukaryotic-like serine/threonine-protein kinase